MARTEAIAEGNFFDDLNAAEETNLAVEIQKLRPVHPSSAERVIANRYRLLEQAAGMRRLQAFERREAIYQKFLSPLLSLLLFWRAKPR